MSKPYPRKAQGRAPQGEQPPRPDKAMPADINAERAALGSILLDRDAIIPVAPWLFAEYFYAEKHAWIYEAQLACYNRRTPPDLATVADELRRRERLDAVGGIPYLIELSNSVPTAVHVEYYGRIVERTGLMRRLIVAGGKIAAMGYDETEDLEQTLDQAEQELTAVAQFRRQQVALSTNDLADEYLARIDRLRQYDGAMVGATTGFLELDKLTGGWQRSDLVILAARPAVGKTSWALNSAYKTAKAGGRVVIFSYEMGRDQLMDRLIASITGIDVQKVRAGKISDDDYQAIVDATLELTTLDLIIVDTPEASIMDLRSMARRIHNEGAIDLIVIDYLQLMSGTARRDGNRVQEVSEISRSLKKLARELNVTIVALSQLSRAVEGRSSHIPMLSDLRESGSLEQDADIVMFIYREELYEPETDKKGLAELMLAKHRNGPTGIVPLRFFKATTTFADLETYRSIDGYNDYQGKDAAPPVSPFVRRPGESYTSPAEWKEDDDA